MSVAALTGLTGLTKLTKLTKWAARRVLVETHYVLNGVLRPGQQYVFLLSHMRSYTSLFSHLLANNPEVDGFQEAKLSYPDMRSLKHLLGAVAIESRRRPGRLVLDKVLHNRLQVCDEILGSERVFPIFMLRRPEATLKSLLSLYSREKVGDDHWSEADALDYYSDRLEGLAQLAQRSQAAGPRPLYLDAEVLTDDTPAAFAALERYLSLATPLTEAYAVHKKSGREGFGDPSANLKTGSIQRKRKSHDAALAPATLARAESAYKHCREILRGACQTL